MDDFLEISFGKGDDEILVGNSKLELSKDEEILVSIARWNEIEKEDGSIVFDFKSGPKFLAANVNYIKGVGAVINKGPEYTKLVGEPTRKVATIVIKWPTDADGKPDLDRIKMGKYDIIPWIFSEAKYKDLYSKNRKKPFHKHDIYITCKDKQYQKYDYDMQDECILRQLQETGGKVFNELVKKIKIVDEKLKPMIGKPMSINDLREKLAENSGSGSASSGADVVSKASKEVFDSSIDDD